jgi:hypothetical protein
MVSRTVIGLIRFQCHGVAPLAIAALLIVRSGSAAHAELDLSPQLEPYELDGVKMSQLTFHADMNDRATYQPPHEWKCSGGKDQLDLQPPALVQVTAKVTKLPPAPAIAFDPEGRRHLIETIIGSLPAGSEQVKVESEELNPLQISGKQTYLIEMSYTFYGERFASYALFLDRKPEPLCFRLSCRESNYQTLRQAFQKSLFSWQNL